MSYTIRFHEAVLEKDFARIDKAQLKTILENIEKKLTENPLQYGEPLRKPLKNYRKFKVRSYRVVYQVEKDQVLIYVVGDRKYIYEVAKKRLL